MAYLEKKSKNLVNAIKMLINLHRGRYTSTTSTTTTTTTTTL